MKKKCLSLLVSSGALLIPVISFAQTSVLAPAKTAAKGLFNDSKDIAQIIVGICLVLGIIHVVYKWSNEDSAGAKKVLINWFVALVVGQICVALIPSN